MSKFFLGCIKLRIVYTFVFLLIYFNLKFVYMISVMSE